MSEDKIIPMDDKTEDKTEASDSWIGNNSNIEEQEELANEVGSKIMELLADKIEKGAHPAAMAMLMADVAATVCIPGGLAGVAIMSGAITRHCKQQLDSEKEISKEQAEFVKGAAAVMKPDGTLKNKEQDDTQ
jgi:hypothetical protein